LRCLVNGKSPFDKRGVVSEQILNANEFYAKMAPGQAKWDLMRQGLCERSLSIGRILIQALFSLYGGRKTEKLFGGIYLNIDI
jgi:hypothetical protein